ncbi:SGNH/GDSL hydrolase family protein [Deinococcus frigens]|uniref:SGNH/GDSL hydrolase family protein n=1 Tax=Deinococcus frigens TaxID=249403 RepID=UPI000496DE77|nr:SGNH/GDSL hydrolase family protein [Deinococcus frigens]
MTYPPNLLRLDPAFRVLLPEGADGGTGELEYQGPYRVAALLAGAPSGIKVIIPDPAGAPRLGKVVALDGTPDVYFLGARSGDSVPPYLTLRVYPDFPLIGGVVDRGEPIVSSGRPHEFPDGSGLWDLQDVGGDERPTIASREQLLTVSQVLADYGLILPNLANATAQLQAVLGEVRAALDNADQSAVLLTLLGSVSDVVTYPALNTPPPGVYNYETGLYRRWVGRLGALQNIARLNVHVRQYDASKPIVSPTLSVRSGSQTGAVLATCALSGLSLTTGADTVLTFDLDSTLANAGGAELWVDLDAGAGALMGLYDTLAGGAVAGTVYYSSTTGYPNLLAPSGTHGIWVQASRKLTTRSLNAAPELLAGVTAGVTAGPLGARVTNLEELTQTPKVQSFTAVEGTFTTAPLPNLTGPLGNAYGNTLGAGLYGWGKLLTTSGPMNAVRLSPGNPITGGGMVEVQVRASNVANAVILARGTVPAAAWNAAAALAEPVTVPLSAAVPAGQVLVMFHAFGERVGYLSGGSGPGVAPARYYFGSAPASYETVAMGIASDAGIYIQPLYAPDLATKRYALASPAQAAATVTAASQTALDQVLGPVDILLPSQISVLKRAGEQFNLYTKHLIPYQWWRIGTVDYDGTYGKQLSGLRDNDCWRLEPSGTGKGYATPVGTFTLTANLKDATLTNRKVATSTVAVIDPAANQTAIRVLCIGDSITYRGQYQAQVMGLGGVTLQGTRTMSANAYLGEGRGGWRLSSPLPDLQGGYVQAGSAGAFDSPFMFPVGVTGADYRGNVEFWKRVVSVDSGATTYAAYDFGGYALAVREGGATVQYAASGYPLNPVTGWVVFDPAKAAGEKFQTWNGAAWVAMGTQPSGFAFNFAAYIARYAWAFTTGAPTHVTVLLGANDWSGTVPDAASLAVWTAQYQTMVDSIHAYSAAIKVIVALPTLPATQDGEGDLYGAGLNGERMRLNDQLVTRALLDRFDTAANRTAKTFVSIFGAGIDPYFGYTLGSAEAPNKYVTDSTLYVRRNQDGIHPGPVGMAQAGDWLAATVQATR